MSSGRKRTPSSGRSSSGSGARPAAASRPEPFRLPRARLAVPFKLRIGDDREPAFSARLPSRDLSVSGAFLESGFFLPVGTRLQVSFQLDEDSPPLNASAEIVRHEPPGPRGEGGFAIRFFEFESGSRFQAAELILGEDLRTFTRRYLKSKRARAFKGDLERLMLDLLASWELHKATSTGERDE